MTDNTTPHSSANYDSEITQTIPFYHEFHAQTLELIFSLGKENIKWLDIGRGTGALAARGLEQLSIDGICLCDISENMLNTAKEKLSAFDVKKNFLAVGSENLSFENQFDVITAVQVHHYLHNVERKKAIKNCFRALKPGGILIVFENIAPLTEYGTGIGLKRWRNYQVSRGKTPEQAENHRSRYGANYFPITITKQLELLSGAGFSVAEPFWLSYMQAEFYAVKL